MLTVCALITSAAYSRIESRGATTAWISPPATTRTGVCTSSGGVQWKRQYQSRSIKIRKGRAGVLAHRLTRCVERHVVGEYVHPA